MAQQQPSAKNRFITFIVMYGALLLLWRWFWPAPPPPPPANAPSLYAQAQALEREGRTEGANVAIADRVQKLEQAIERYQQYYDQNQGREPVPADVYQARFQIINIYDYLATRLEGRKSGTHWYDQAMLKLKEMEEGLHGKQGTVTLEIEGQTTTRSGDLAQIAADRLNLIRQARDRVNEDKWTYKTLDILVNLFGGRRYPQISYFLALFFVVVVLKVATWPFQKKQYQYMRDIGRIGPILKEETERMKARGATQEEISRRTMELYRENNVNLAAGCLPMLVLMVVLFPVYWMVADYEYQFTYGKFLWVGSEISSRYWWLADNLAQFDVPLFITYMLSMVLFSLLQPKPQDAQAATQQKMMIFMMPAVFGVMMWMYKWSSAFMLYWLVLNIVSAYQSWSLMRRYGVSTPLGGGGSGPPASGNAPEGAAKPAAKLQPMQGPGNGKKSGKSNGKRNPKDARGLGPRGSGRRPQG